MGGNRSETARPGECYDACEGSGNRTEISKLNVSEPHTCEVTCRVSLQGTMKRRAPSGASH